MNFLLFVVPFTSLRLAAVIQRRQSDFIKTHQEHGHLPGGENNPGPAALIPQLMRVLDGENPLSVLGSYNQAAKEKGSGTVPAEVAQNNGPPADAGHSHGPQDAAAGGGPGNYNQAASAPTSAGEVSAPSADAGYSHSPPAAGGGQGNAMPGGGLGIPNLMNVFGLGGLKGLLGM